MLISKELIEEVLEVKLPRWNELPNFDVYSDQLINIVENSCKAIYIDKDKIITKSMVNNYVKLYRVPKPEKKKYGKVQIAYCLILTVLKSVLTIDEVIDGIELMSEKENVEESYDLFCDEFENSIKEIFTPMLDYQDKYLIPELNLDRKNLGVVLICKSLSYKLLIELILYEKNQEKDKIPQ